MSAVPGSTADADIRFDEVGIDAWPRIRALLCEGYPDVPAVLWDQGAERMRRVPLPAPDAPLAHLQVVDGRTIGVGLTLTRHALLEGPGRATASAQVNLSSWAIMPAARQHAARMARDVVRDAARAYTILTPIAATARIFQRQGFAPIAHQLVVVPTPAYWRARDDSDARVLDAAATLDSVRGQPLERALDDHLRLDCNVWGLQTSTGIEPLVVRKRRRRGLPVAEILFAPSQKSLVRHAGVLARHALRTGHAFLEFDGHQDLEVPIRCMRMFRRRIGRGPYTARGIDYLYSELVYLLR